MRRAPSAPEALRSGPSPLVFALVGVGGVALLAIVALLVVLTRPGPERAAGGGGGAPAVADAAPIKAPQPVAAPAFTPTSATEPASTSASSSSTDSADVPRRLKEATVYIKNKVAGKTLGTGTGFVIEVMGDTVILATNRHVAVLDLSEIPERFVPKGSVAEIEAVFRSGQGPQNEQALPAQIIAADLSGDFSRDLAFLMVKGVKRPPSPINPLAKVEPTEGMSYKAGGFPFGGMLAKVSEDSSKGNPSVSITGGSIAALRRDDHGQILLLQVDGSLQPGNSGGPIVDEKTGKLLGVAVAKNALVDTIGLVVPADEVRKALAGRVGSLDLTLSAVQQGSADLEIKAMLVDPKRQVKSVMVHVAPASAGSITPNSDGTWPPLPNTKEVELKHDPQTASASGQVQVALSGQGAGARKVLIQTGHRDAHGQLVLSKPKEFDLPEKPGRIRPPGTLERIVKAARHRSAALLGSLIDPEKDCKLVKDEDGLKFKIEVPGNKVRTLSPYVVTRLNKRKPLHNAPMVLADVEGDFVAMVEVTGEMSPGSKMPKDKQGNIIPFTFNGAGLVLYEDKDNFVRLERTAGIDISNLQSIHKVLIEIVKEGKQLDTTNVYWPVPEGNVQLFMIRRKGKARFQFRSSGSAATFASPEFELDLPKKVKVGLTAGNISAKPFTANFQDFALLNDVTMIDEEFGDADKNVPQKKAP
jgi:S1-C subfamily serine protease/regulation of enolase protein 1 (concanavalin A-like superfamily)